MPISQTHLGWKDRSPDHPEVVAQRAYLAANNGIRGLEIFAPDQVDGIVRVFRRDGFVVVDQILSSDRLNLLRESAEEVVAGILALDPDRKGNRGSHRYSFGAASTTGSLLHLPAWRMLVDLPVLTPIITAIFGSADYMLRGAGGDFCLPGAYRYQPLHSDMGDWRSAEETPNSSFSDPRGFLSTRELPCPYVCVNFLTVDATATNGSTRQIPGSQHSREPFPTLEEEPEWMKLSAVCPAPAGAVQIRDVRAWHGGTPNLSDNLRAIPNVEFYAPWFRERVRPSLAKSDHDQMSDHGKRLTRHQVIDSTELLNPQLQLNTTPPRLRTSAAPTASSD